MTAIQQLMNVLNELHPNLLNVHTNIGREFVKTCHKFLQVEKQQIIKAYQQGVTDEHGDTITFTTEGEDYYNTL
jgi:hypothetical protein